MEGEEKADGARKEEGCAKGVELEYFLAEGGVGGGGRGMADVEEEHEDQEGDSANGEVDIEARN